QQSYTNVTHINHNASDYYVYYNKYYDIPHYFMLFIEHDDIQKTLIDLITSGTRDITIYSDTHTYLKPSCRLKFYTTLT
uniref:Uncharacterized protein n=1 Tax=Romanomermis culicivorax TaxID=13658 RepID=A0A915IJP8_ROMCU